MTRPSRPGWTALALGVFAVTAAGISLAMPGDHLGWPEHEVEWFLWIAAGIAAVWALVLGTIAATALLHGRLRASGSARRADVVAIGVIAGGGVALFLAWSQISTWTGWPGILLVVAGVTLLVRERRLRRNAVRR